MSAAPVLTISRAIRDIQTPVQKTSLKYQCIGVCHDFICLGATSGSTYAFSRANGKLVKFFGHKVNAIVGLKFSNDEKLLAVADSSGTIICWEVDAVKKDFKVVKEINDFHGTLVTSMCWNVNSSRLFIGNKQGLVVAFHVGVVAFYTSETIRKAGDPIVQMDCSMDRLVISSTTKAIVCFLDRSQFHQIGTKPRDGQYGACFMKNTNSGLTFIYSARPGSRLWEVDFSGQVLATHQFKEALSIPPTPIVTAKNISLPESDEMWDQPQSFNFPQLIPVMDRFILTWSPRGIYLIDPAIGSAVLWNDQIKEIIGISCTKGSIYILHSDGSVTEISLFTVKECLLDLQKQEHWLQLAKVACAHDEEILTNVELYLSVGFYDILVKIKESEVIEDEEAVEKFEKFIEDVDAKHAEFRAKVQEKMNQMIQNSADTSFSSEPDADELEDVRSNASDGMSETSSKISMSRLSEVRDTLVQKATSAMVSKVIKAGFMKRAFRDALESEGVILELENKKHPDQPPGGRPRTHSNPPSSQSVPTSPRQPRSNALGRSSSDYMLTQAESVFLNDGGQEVSGGLQQKALSSPVLTSTSDANLFPPKFTSSSCEKDEEVIVQRGRKKMKKKKKAKLIKLENTEGKINMSDDADKLTQEIAGNTRKESPPVNHSRTENEVIARDSRVQREEFGLNAELSLSFSTAEEISGETSSKSSITLEANDGNQEVEKNASLMFTLPSNTLTIVNTLVNTTFSTRNDIREAGILYNRANFLDKVKRWSCCLERVTGEFREECFRALDSRIQREMNNMVLAYLDIQCNNLFFSQCHAAFSEVCSVAMLCLETNGFPEKFSSMKSHEIALLNTEITVDEIIQKAHDYVEKILGSTETPIESGRESERESENSVSTIEKPRHPKKILEKLSTVGNASQPEFTRLSDILQHKNVKELLFDKRSLSTIASESSATAASESNADSSSGGGDNVMDSIDVLVENPKLCENLNKNEYDSCEECALDKCRACFVLRYFAVVNFARIRTLLSWSSRCRWRTWLACVVRLKYSHRSSELQKLLESSSSTDIAILSEVKEADIKVVLANSTEISNRSPELMVECAGLKNLSQWEMTLLFYTGLLDKKPLSSNVDTFLNYAMEIIGDNAKLDTVFVNCVLYSAVENHPDRDVLFCSSCSQARPGSNRIEWKWDSLLKKLIACLLKTWKSAKYKPMLDRAANVCLKSGYWCGYLQLISKSASDSKEVIQLLCQLGDSELLVKLIDESGVLFSEEDWSFLLQEFMKIRKRNADPDNQCHPVDGWVPTMTPEKIIKLIGIHCGPRYALACLKDVTKTDWDSYHGVYTALLQALELESKQELIISKLIEVASANVWSQTKSVIPHEFQVIKEAELRGAEYIISPPLQENNTDAVWGRNISISSAECPVCTLPLCLKSTISSHSAALLVFQCGHSFHKICVPENACLVCYHEHFSTIF